MCRKWILRILLLLVAFPVAAAESRLKAAVDPGIEARLTEELQIDLVVKPKPGEAWSELARRVTGDGANWKSLADVNGAGKVLTRDRSVRVPVWLARPSLQRKAMLALFPHDHPSESGWLHRVAIGGTAAEGEPLWKISEWFTGDGANYSKVKTANGRTQLSTRKGEVILIPDSLLGEAFRLDPVRKAKSARAPAVAEDDPPVVPVTDHLIGPVAPVDLAVLRSDEPVKLGYVRTGERPYAVYKLKKGEALYSSVVIRFTGRIFAKDVYEVVDQLVTFNGIDDVSRLPVGYDVKIPLDLLLTEYRPVDDPSRLEHERAKRESQKLARRVEAKNLEGVAVILDAGHGGRDVGTEHKGVWESSYVYDVVCRLKRILEEQSGARVYVTTRSATNGYKIQNRDVLKNFTDHSVLTTPEYDPEDAVIGVNLRWYLANSIYRKVSKNTAPEKVIFISVHADSLHPSLRGAMAYIPGQRFVEGTFRKSGAVYLARSEVKESPSITQSKQDALYAEGLSMDLGESIIDAFRAADLQVHPFNPVRDNVVRGGREWVPAVIRYNKVPARVLVEICNLGNEADRKLIQTKDYRDAIARAINQGIVKYYGVGSGGGSTVERMAVAGR